uniref:ATP synthase epsilon chain, chloroplastic n=1 Tax=Schizocladia ischiensis TaxID=196139 RepID=A0A7S6U9U1_9STRA|nr:AtpE [Schizocladia ischiensis]QOW07482.1 AtpE [Schizocladia ischiensis]
MGVKIRVMAPDRSIWDTEVDEVVLPGLNGQIGVLPGHAPLITSLEIGILRIKLGSSWEPIIVFGGFAVIKNDEVIALISGAEEIIRGEYDKAKQILKQTKDLLLNITDTKEKIEVSQDVKRAKARVEAYDFFT